MRTTARLTFLLSFIVLASNFAEAQSVTITPEKVTYTRPQPLTEFKKTFEITFPRVNARTPALSKKIESMLDYEKLFDFTIAEEKGESQWLEEASYEVGFNEKRALSIALSIQGSGAYPSGVTKHLVINTATGNRATPATEFTNTVKLVSKLSGMLKKEIREAIRKIQADKENEDIVPSELFAGKRFRTADLQEFSIGTDGVTFHYAYNFVHAVQALEPEGKFRLSWAEISPYLRKGGLLASIAH